MAAVCYIMHIALRADDHAGAEQPLFAAFDNDTTVEEACRGEFSS
jgi:hypothetical protein